MQVEIIFTMKEITDHLLQGKAAVVIDTLRATSTIVTALYNGAKTVEPKLGIEESKRRASELSVGSYILGGEREGVKIAGFDLGNSPIEYSPTVVRDKTVILSTTNGTITIKRAWAAERVLIGSLLNAQATMLEVARYNEDLVFCCSGTQGSFSLEDFITAGAMVFRLKAAGVKITGDDRVNTALLLYQRYRNELSELMSCSQNGLRLIEIGQKPDINFCACEDSFPIICYFDGICINTVTTETYLCRK